jgi:hypothetical protein
MLQALGVGRRMTKTGEAHGDAGCNFSGSQHESEPSQIL